MVSNVLGTQRLEGMLGFDWATYRGDPLPSTPRWTFGRAARISTSSATVRPDRIAFGYNQVDTLRGTNNVAGDLQGSSGIIYC